MAMGRGQISKTVLAAAAAWQVEAGVARSQILLPDTSTAQVEGTGAVDLREERFTLEIETKPKSPSLLSLRGPLHVQGSFLDASVSVDAATLLRGGAAAALALIDPLAALLPPIETGPGEDSDCKEVLGPVAAALNLAAKKSIAAPTPTPQKL
jgi:uncharacterized protein involved in outer membrane biogenesis